VAVSGRWFPSRTLEFSIAVLHVTAVVLVSVALAAGPGVTDQLHSMIAEEDVSSPIARHETGKGAEKTMDAAQIQRHRAAAAVSLVLMILQVLGGVLASSLSVVALSLGSFSDAGESVLSAWALDLVLRRATPQYSFGLQQAGALGALLKILMVWVMACALSLQAMRGLLRLTEVSAPLLLGVALACWALRALLAAPADLAGILRGHGAGSEGAAERFARRAPLAVALLGLLLQAFPEALGRTGGIPRWAYADPALALAIAAATASLSSRRALREALLQILMACPGGLDLASLRSGLLAVEGVVSVHDLHVWQTGPLRMCSAHVVVRHDGDWQEALVQCTALARDPHGIDKVTFQVEVQEVFDRASHNLRLSTTSCHDTLR